MAQVLSSETSGSVLILMQLIGHTDVHAACQGCQISGRSSVGQAWCVHILLLFQILGSYNCAD